MSAKWRNQRGIGSVRNAKQAPMSAPVADNDVVGQHEAYHTEEAYESEPNENGNMMTLSDQYPGPRKSEHREADGFIPDKVTMPYIGVIRDNVDWEVGGVRGEVGDLPYTLGVVESNTVENFELDGKQALIRRGRNPSDTGPVGTADSNALLALQYAMQANQYFPNETSQADMAKAV